MLTTIRPGINSDRAVPVVYRTEDIPAVLDLLDPFLQRSADESFGMADLDYLQKMLLSGNAHAFAMVRQGMPVFVIVVAMVEYATFRSARILACAGENLRGASQYFDALAAWALTQGAVEIEGWCRPSMVRFAKRFGWRPRVQIIIKDLRGKLQ